MDLDNQQREAVEHGDGPLLVVSGPGSGKTRVLVHRVAHMVQTRHISPDHILVTTFTKKAAEEMRERLRFLIGNAADDLWLGTVHSRCLEVLRKGGPEKVGLPKNFTVSGDDDSRKLAESTAKQVATELAARDNRQHPDDVSAIAITEAMEHYGLETMHSKISFAKEWNYGPDEAVSALDWKPAAKEAYTRYNTELRKSGKADFGDLQMLTVKMLEDDPEILEWIRKRFQYVLVDEYQDTNKIQARLFRLICEQHRNLTVVGDVDQCIPEGQRVSTPTGDVQIEKIQVGDTVLATRGGKLVVAKVLRQSTSEHDKVLEFRTESGRVFRCTPNHVIYSSLSRQKDGSYFVYLMWKRDVGWRIGITASGFLTHEWGRVTRASCEHAERMWFLRKAATVNEARFLETELSLRYRIPTCTFVPRPNEVLPENSRLELFKEFDNGLEVLLAFGLSFERPIYLAKAQGDGPISVNVDQASSTGTLVSIFSSRVPEAFVERWNCKVQQRGDMKYGRLRVLFKSYRKAVEFAQEVCADLEVPAYISYRLGVGWKKASVRPIDAVQLWPGMQVVTLDGKETKREFVVDRKEIDSRYLCYDLEVEDLANYFVGGICVHNSVYAFRGASPEFMLAFEKEWPGAKVVRLDQNYRSTKGVVAAANSVILNNTDRFDFQPRTENSQGARPQIVRAIDQEAEADWIAARVRYLHDREHVPYKEMAVLYRTHRLSRHPESSFRAARLPYEVIGGQPFFARREVQDLLAWLTLLVNPKDRDNFRRAMFAPPRGVGDVTLKRFFASLDTSGSDIITHARNGMLTQVLAKQRRAIREFGDLLVRLQQVADSSDLLSIIARDTKYAAFLRTQEGGDARMENVEELCGLYAAYDPPGGDDTKRPLAFLDWAATELQRTEAREKHGGDAVPMMTMHAAKGTEFDTVFVVGCVNGITPSFRAEDEEALEEERRLFYVAMTRAKRRLYLMVPAQRVTATGEKQPTSPSPFLYEAADGGAEWSR